MSQWASAWRDRYLDLLASVYLYNEHRGYTSLDRVIGAVRQFCPDEPEFLAEVLRHRADEHKHYHMFRRWFERKGRMPLALDHRVGHIDHFIQRSFGCTIDELDTDRVARSAAEFEQLCRVIMLTEQRGYRQVEVLLANRWVRSDPVMTRIFAIIHQDEPGHFLPYQDWLERRGRPTTLWRERWTDCGIHCGLVFGRLPALLLNPALPRLERWPHEAEPA